MKRAISLVSLFLLLVGTVAAQNKKPNIVLIFADDLGYMDCGFNGDKRYETPNLDRLAGEGMVFNNAYAAAGNCAPSRACLLSGLYTPRHGVYAVNSTTRGPKDKMKLVPVKNNNALDPGFVTVAEALKAQGYATGVFGKWHLGKTETTSPLAQGFDEYFDSREPNPNKKRDEPQDPKGIFSITDAAIKFMDKQSKEKKPFFTFISHHAIHGALEGKPETIEHFKKKGMDNKTANYAACIYNLDEGVQQVVDFLKRAGLDKNTLLVFTSDNGATPQSPQQPLRGHKGGYYEGSIREPFVAYWPGKIKAGTLSEVPIINVDLYPTFLAMAGKSDVKLDGENLLPVFTGNRGSLKRKNIYWHFPGYLDNSFVGARDSIFRTRPVTTMRKGDWKMLLYHEEWILDGGLKNVNSNNAIELYDLKADIGEKNNLALKNKAKRDELLKDMLLWIEKEKVRLPVKIDENNKPDDSDGDGGAE